jgi:hypothetical protein
MRKFAFACVAALAAAVPARAEIETIAMDAGVAPFEVKAVTGPKKGEELCYRCSYGSAPVVCIFATEMNDKVAAACKDLDKQLGENKALKGFVVMLSDDCPCAEKTLTEVAAKHELKNLPLTVFKGKAGPEGYKISKDAGVTLVMWNGGKVAGAKAYAPGSFCDHCCGSQVAAFVKKTAPAGS